MARLPLGARVELSLSDLLERLLAEAGAGARRLRGGRQVVERRVEAAAGGRHPLEDRLAGGRRADARLDGREWHARQGRRLLVRGRALSGELGGGLCSAELSLAWRLHLPDDCFRVSFRLVLAGRAVLAERVAESNLPSPESLPRVPNSFVVTCALKPLASAVYWTRRSRPSSPRSV